MQLTEQHKILSENINVLADGLPKILSLLRTDSGEGLLSSIKIALDDSSSGLPGIVSELSTSSSSLGLLQSTLGNKDGGQSVLELLRNDNYGLQSIKNVLDVTIKTELGMILQQVNGLNTQNTIDILDKIAKESGGVTANQTLENQIVIQKIGDVKQEVLDLELLLIDSTTGLPGVVSKVTSARASIEGLLQNSGFGLEHIKDAIDRASGRLSDGATDGLPKQLLDLLQSADFGLQSLKVALDGISDMGVDARNSESLSIVAQTERIGMDIKDHTSEIGDSILNGVGILEGRINDALSTQANKMLSTISAEATSTRSAVDNTVAALQKDVSDAQKYLQEKVATKAEINVMKSEIIDANAELESEIIDAKAKIEAIRSEMKLELSEAKAELEALIGKPAPNSTGGLSSDVARVLPSGGANSGEVSVGSALGASLGLEVEVRCLPRMRNSKDGAVMLDVMVNTQSYGDDCDANITQVLAVYTNENGDYKSQTGKIQDIMPVSTGMHIVRIILNKDDDANFEMQYVTSLRITATKTETEGGIYKKSVILDYSGCYEMHRQAAQNSKANRLLERMVKLLRKKIK